MQTHQKIKAHKASASAYAKLLLYVSLTVTLPAFADTKLLNETTDGSDFKRQKRVVLQLGSRITTVWRKPRHSLYVL
jgi:hypothetical protein